MKDTFKKEPSLQNKRAVNIANKMGKRYTLLDAMLMGKKLKIDWKKSKFTMGDLLVGMHYELEHGKVDADTNVTNDNALKTAKIAWAHLKERPDYYVQLMKIDPPKKMEKVANSVFAKMEKRGLTPTGVISSRVNNMPQLNRDRAYGANHSAILAESTNDLSKMFVRLDKKYGFSPMRHRQVEGNVAKCMWDNALSDVKNPPGKTMKDIRDNAIQKYLINARAARKYTKASNAVKEYLAKRASDELNDMVKEAAPRWRREWGGLSADSQKRLQMPGQIASRELETAKRMSGVQKVSQKFGVKRYSDQMPQFPLPKKSHPKTRSFVEGVNEFINDIGHDIGPHNAKIGKFQYTFNPEQANNDHWLQRGGSALSRAGKKDLLQLKYQNKPLYNEIGSILAGHEMLGEAATINTKKHLLSLPGKLLYRKHNPVGPYQGHHGPSVMHWESAAVATASPEAKEFMKNLRSHDIYTPEKSLVAKVYKKRGVALGDFRTEIGELKDIGGIEYGKDAIINKAKEKAHRTAYRDEIHPLLRRGRK